MRKLDLSDDVFNEVLRLARQYHRQAKKCRDSKAFLAGCVMIGAAFEAMLLSFANCFPVEALRSSAAPRKNGAVRPLLDWSLANLLAVAKECEWLPSGLSPGEDWDDAKAQIGDYGDLIKDMRNLVHPARYAIDRPGKRITKKYLEAAFDIIDVANGHLVHRISEATRQTLEKAEAKGA